MKAAVLSKLSIDLRQFYILIEIIIKQKNFDALTTPQKIMSNKALINKNIILYFSKVWPFKVSE